MAAWLSCYFARTNNCVTQFALRALRAWFEVAQWPPMRHDASFDSVEPQVGPDFLLELVGQALRYWWFLAGFVVVLVVALWAKAGGLAGGYRKPKGPAADAIARADWRQFERLTALALREAGYRVRENPGEKAKADGGVDLVAHRNGKRHLVQCKHLRSPVSVKVVRELYGEMAARDADGCIVASSGPFGKPARKWAAGRRRVQLLDGGALARMLDGAEVSDAEGCDKPPGEAP